MSAFDPKRTSINSAVGLLSEPTPRPFADVGLRPYNAMSELGVGYETARFHQADRSFSGRLAACRTSATKQQARQSRISWPFITCAGTCARQRIQAAAARTGSRRR